MCRHFVPSWQLPRTEPRLTRPFLYLCGRIFPLQSAILTAKHGCGFLLWPTNVTLPNGENYGYHVGGKGGIGVDIVGMFTKEITAAGLPHSFYYSLKDSFYLNAINDNVKPPGTALPGQVRSSCATALAW